MNENIKNEYLLLNRLVTDCKYFLGNGGRNEKFLWAKSAKAQIAEMKLLYERVPVKPEWLTMEDIENYAEKMKVR